MTDQPKDQIQYFTGIVKQVILKEFQKIGYSNHVNILNSKKPETIYINNIIFTFRYKMVALLLLEDNLETVLLQNEPSLYPRLTLQKWQEGPLPITKIQLQLLTNHAPGNQENFSGSNWLAKPFCVTSVIQLTQDVNTDGLD